MRSGRLKGLMGHGNAAPVSLRVVTPEYDATVAFYRDDLQLVVLESWDRGADDRGTLFAAAYGIIEVLFRSTSRAASHCGG